ncbi:hypothetical protein [Mucilaginibacter sp.]|uniref:hypothetical protein n=1 Tax=Mucilaginibacter sp. TaxID=1882438 RepID=UPI0028463806|nr:hypothetical protein [Mucilaginibacter sp.]MDR3694966.1 hypothetical protein [Mucilaginibacter sp.]
MLLNGRIEIAVRLFCIVTIFLVLSSCGSKHDEQADIKNCPLIPLKDTILGTIRNKLESPIDDSLTNSIFIINYRKDKWLIKDAKNKWENQYSQDYEGIKVESFTNDYVLIFCPYSGITENYKLSPNKFNDMYLLDRKNGAIIKHIVFQGGLGNAIIYKGAVYAQFDSSEVHRCVFHSPGANIAEGK